MDSALGAPIPSPKGGIKQSFISLEGRPLQLITGSTENPLYVPFEVQAFNPTDSSTRLNLNLLPNENIKLYFQTQQTEPSDFLEGGKKFFSEDFLDTYGFFQDYDDEVREDINKMKNGINGNRTK